MSHSADESAELDPRPVVMPALIDAAQQLLEASWRERLEQTEKMATLGLVATCVAHEINNPSPTSSRI